jgi:hypothetical protein
LIFLCQRPGRMDRALSNFDSALRVALRYAKKRKLVKVKNKETGKIVYKTPEVFKRKRDLYVELPQEYDRNPKGRPRKTPNPADVYLPAPEKLPRPKKRPKPKKLPKLPKLVPLPEVPRPPKEAPRDPPLGQKWQRA